MEAINPIYAIRILFSPANKVGILILGSVFLATTGAEALYSDVGHVGKANIMGSWPYVFVCLSLNYLGQGAWILHNASYHAGNGEIHSLKLFLAICVFLPSPWLRSQLSLLPRH